jgi:thymidylate synthase
MPRLRNPRPLGRGGCQIHLKDPPCLREIDTRIFSVEALHEGEEAALHFIIYFRSWDLWNGFPANLAAIRLMQEDMAYRIGVEAGEMIVSSKGLHIYDHAWNLAKLRVNR